MPSLMGIRVVLSLETKDLPNLNVSTAIDLGPNGENIFTLSNTENGSTNLIRSFGKLIPHYGHQQLFPVPVSHSLFESHDPFASSLVLFVLPNRSYALFEEVIVGDLRQHGWSLQMNIDLPKLHDGRHCAQRLDGLLIVRILATRRSIPDNPAMFQ